MLGIFSVDFSQMYKNHLGNSKQLIFDGLAHLELLTT